MDTNRVTGTHRGQDQLSHVDVKQEPGACGSFRGVPAEGMVEKNNPWASGREGGLGAGPVLEQNRCGMARGSLLQPSQ